MPWAYRDLILFLRLVRQVTIPGSLGLALCSFDICYLSAPTRGAMEPASFTSMVGNSNFHPADKENSYMQKEKKATGIICIYIFFFLVAEDFITKKIKVSAKGK